MSFYINFILANYYWLMHDFSGPLPASQPYYTPTSCVVKHCSLSISAHHFQQLKLCNLVTLGKFKKKLRWALRQCCTLCYSFKLIAIISTEKNRVQNMVEMWTKKKERKNNRKNSASAVTIEYSHLRMQKQQSQSAENRSPLSLHWLDFDTQKPQ